MYDGGNFDTRSNREDDEWRNKERERNDSGAVSDGIETYADQNQSPRNVENVVIRRDSLATWSGAL